MMPTTPCEARGFSRIPTRALVGAGVLALSAVLSCQTNSKEKARLISALAQKADSVVDRATAYGLYRFAGYYAPHDTAIAAKFAARSWTVGFIQNAQETANLFFALTVPKTGVAFPQAPQEMDLVNLRMLLDGRLVGGLSYDCFSAEEYDSGRLTVAVTFPPDDSVRVGASGKICFFTSTPHLSLSQVRDLYGKPSVDGGTVLTYGIFRLVADSGALVRLVLFPPFPASRRGAAGPAAVPPCDLGADQLVNGGLGRLVPGAHVALLQLMCPNLDSIVRVDDEGRINVLLRLPVTLRDTVFVETQGRQVFSFSIFSPGIATDDSLRVGSSFRELLAKHPCLLLEEHARGLYAWPVPNHGAGFRLSMDIRAISGDWRVKGAAAIPDTVHLTELLSAGGFAYDPARLRGRSGCRL